MHRFGFATLSLWMVLVALFALGCGGKQAASQNTASTSSAPVQSTWEPPPLPTDGAIKLLGLTGPDDKPWQSMSYDEKEWYMVGKVHPIMRQIFQTLDKAKYEGLNFECTPCHGEKPEERKYKMPSDHLSAIPAYGTEDWKAMENSRIVKFMNHRVTPAMAKLIGEKPYDLKTGEGFSCWGCHPKQ